jgi:uncharacterized protein YndB with AHSA1/START domain
MVEPNLRAPGAGRVLELARDFDAPRELVFRAWTEPEQLAQWWGPAIFTSVVHEWRAVPDGAFRLDMHAPDGTVFPMHGVFREVVPPERLVFNSVNLTGAGGHTLFETQNSVTFAEHGGGARPTVRVEVSVSIPESAVPESHMEQGWNENLERLAKHLRRRTEAARD